MPKSKGAKDEIRSGLVVRGVSKQGVFTKEEVDLENRLQEASVNCVDGNELFPVAIKGMKTQNYKRGYATASVTDIRKNGGKVLQRQMEDNKHHCEIFGLPLKIANNLFSNVQDWPSIDPD